MPLYKTITVNPSTIVYIWKITESFEALAKDTPLTAHCQERVDGMKSMIHKQGFMSVRHLLALAGYTDFDLFYTKAGKPYLKDGKHISITHSFSFSAIIVSDKKVGIDIEMQRPVILKIAHKFTPLEEYRTLANEAALIRKLTMVWAAKESLYKGFAENGVSFLKHIYVEAFSIEKPSTQATVTYRNRSETYGLKFLEFEDFTCGYATILKPN